MGRKSSVARLDPRVKQAVDRALQEGRATIDEIVAMVSDLGAALGTGDEVKRSAVGRYKQNFEAGMETYRATQAMASAWGREMKDDPEGEVSRLASQVLGAVALNTAQAMINDDGAVPASEVAFLARALDSLSKAEQTRAALAARLRREVAEETAQVAEAEARRQGISAAGVESLRAAIMSGLAA
jgi:hypothetical protein